MRLRTSLLERIKARSVKRGDCIEWTGYTNYLGYGKLTFHNQLLSAHRAAFIANGGVIPDGMFVCHKCDNRKCVNPEHLFVGTRQDNIKDMVNKGRNKRGDTKGSKHWNASLTEDDVRTIRSSNESNVELAKRYGTSNKNISAVRHRHIWKHV